MTYNAQPLFGDDLTRVADLLDRCLNGLGPIPTDVRARIFAAMDNPCETTWLKARSSIITREPETTLWQSVISNGNFPEDAPTRTELINSITNTLAGTVPPSAR